MRYRNPETIKASTIGLITNSSMLKYLLFGWTLTEESLGRYRRTPPKISSTNWSYTCKIVISRITMTINLDLKVRFFCFFDKVFFFNVKKK